MEKWPPQAECFYCKNRIMFPDGDMQCFKPDESLEGYAAQDYEGDKPLPGTRKKERIGWGYPEKYDPLSKKTHCKNFNGKYPDEGEENGEIQPERVQGGYAKDVEMAEREPKKK